MDVTMGRFHFFRVDDLLAFSQMDTENLISWICQTFHLACSLALMPQLYKELAWERGAGGAFSQKEKKLK